MSVLEAAGDPLPEVVTVKVKSPVDEGPAAVKSTSTSSPVATLQEAARSTVIVVVPTRPPLVPAWKQAVSLSSMRATVVGTVANAADEVMVTELAPVPDSAAVARNFTTKGVGALCDNVAGEATTPATAFVGVPMAYGAVTTSA